MAVLVGMYVTAALPLWTGAEIRLATAPVDPRSLFRGNYALLSYDISEIDSTYF
ncbi:MAG: GDYXXLXY domain-containing protein [Gammaproteobacteria bacterium]|nr:GDYXXLXY domain-containing protein [Gammaproteobacteria bacterium]